MKKPAAKLTFSTLAPHKTGENYADSIIRNEAGVVVGYLHREVEWASRTDILCGEGDRIRGYCVEMNNDATASFPKLADARAFARENA